MLGRVHAVVGRDVLPTPLSQFFFGFTPYEGKFVIRTLFALTALLGAGWAASADEFQSREMPPIGTFVPRLHEAHALPNGDIVLIEGNDSNRSRLSRFDANGQLLATVPLRKSRFGIAITPDGELVSAECHDGDVAAHAASGSMRWRFDSASLDAALGSVADCYFEGVTAKVGLDRESGLWALANSRSLSYSRADSGPEVIYDLAHIVSADFRAERLFAWPSRDGVLVSSATDSQTHQLAALTSQGQLAWRFISPTVNPTETGWQVAHVITATPNDGGALAIVDLIYQDGGFNLSLPETLAIRIAVLDVDGEVRWQQQLDEADPAAPSAQFPVAAHLFNDGSFALSTYSGRRLHTRRFDVQGQLLSERRDTLAGRPRCEFAEAQSAHWMVCEDGARSFALSLEDPARIELSSAPFNDAVRRADGSVLAIFGDHSPYALQRFVGTSPVTSFTLTAPPGDIAPNVYSPSAELALADGDLVLLNSEQLRRIGPAGEVRWTRPLNDITGFNLIAGANTQLLLIANQVCSVLSNPDRKLLCFDQSSGQQVFLRRLPGPAGESVRVVMRDAGLELMFRDSARHVHHWLLSPQNVLLFSRDLGLGEIAWLDADIALARSFEGQPALIHSDRNAPEAVRIELPGGSALAYEPIVAHVNNSDWLSVATSISNGISSMHVRRYDANLMLQWSRSIVGAIGLRADAGGLISADASGIRVLIRDAAGNDFAHFLDAATGNSSAAPIAINASDASVLPGPDGTFGVLSSTNGTIAWRVLDANGMPRSAAAWRCPDFCSTLLSRTEAGTLSVVAGPARVDGGIQGLSLLTLADAFAPRNAPVADDGAIAGVFTAVNETNRGYVIDWLPSSRTLFVARFAGDTSSATIRQLLDWETMQGTVNAGASEVVLTRYRSANGRFAATDDAPTTAFGSATFRFDGCDRAELTMTGNETFPAPERVQLIRSGPRLKACNLLAGGSIAAEAERPARGGFDARQSGAWIAPGANDQGILAGVLPATADANGVFFAPWFTYWPDAGNNSGTANRHWLTLQAALTPASNGSVELTIFRATAGSYGAIRPSNTYRVGTATWTLTDCEHATLSYQFDADESAQPYSGRSGVQNYARPGACSGGP
jgi:hypothetical protein